MRRTTPEIVRLLSAVLFCVLLLISCGKNPPEETAYFDWSDYVIVTPVGGLPYEYRIPDGKVSVMKVPVITDLKSAIGKATGSEPAVGNEFGEKHAREIIVGNTTREESEELRAGLRKKDYAVVYRNGSFIVCGGSDEALIEAVKAFARAVPTLRADLDEGDVLRHVGNYAPEVRVFINGIDIEKYSFSQIYTIMTSNPWELASQFETLYGYELKATSSTRYDKLTGPKITAPGARYIVFGKGDGFLDDAPEAEPGTAVVLCNGTSIMIYSDEETQRIYPYLLKLIERTPTVDGKNSVEIPVGVTVID